MHPTHIRKTKSHELHIVWDDGGESTFSTGFLRSQCPCATCMHEREENQNAGLFSLPIANQTDLRNIDLSGHNAMIITWGDGHKAGIFTWDYLRQIGEQVK